MLSRHTKNNWSTFTKKASKVKKSSLLFEKAISILISSSQVNGTKSTSFLKERSGLSTIVL